MIKIERVDVWGFEHAIRGMRNPMNSWEKSDSAMCHVGDGFEDCTVNACGVCPRHEDFRHDIFCVGENDLDLMTRLYNGGTEHRKYMRQIFVSMDITAPLYWWKEFDTYKVGTTANSCSTMHKIHAKEFTLDDFSHDRMTADGIETLMAVIDHLNRFRGYYLETKDKDYWYDMIQSLPSSYNQMRTVTMNYENVVSMIHQRENHKLDEWRAFCEIVGALPYIDKITG